MFIAFDDFLVCFDTLVLCATVDGWSCLALKIFNSVVLTSDTLRVLARACFAYLAYCSSLSLHYSLVETSCLFDNRKDFFYFSQHFFSAG